MGSILIKDTTRQQREQIVAESIGNISGSCDGCMSGLAEMYQDYIDGKKRSVRSTWSSEHIMNRASMARRKQIAGTRDEYTDFWNKKVQRYKEG